MERNGQGSLSYMANYVCSPKYGQRVEERKYSRQSLATVRVGRGGFAQAKPSTGRFLVRCALGLGSHLYGWLERLFALGISQSLEPSPSRPCHSCFFSACLRWSSSPY